MDAKTFAKEKKLSLEEGARILRYQAFEEFLTKSKSSKLATAHTANDQAETVIDHFLRGSGSLGMQGMQKQRGPYIRPLLELTREELELKRPCGGPVFELRASPRQAGRLP